MTSPLTSPLTPLGGYVLLNVYQLLAAGTGLLVELPVTEPLTGPYEITSNVPDVVLISLEVGEKTLIDEPGCPIGHLVAKLGRLPIDGPDALPGSTVRFHLFNESWATVQARVTFYAHRKIAP